MYNPSTLNQPTIAACSGSFSFTLLSALTTLLIYYLEHCLLLYVTHSWVEGGNVNKNYFLLKLNTNITQGLLPDVESSEYYSSYIISPVKIAWIALRISSLGLNSNKLKGYHVVLLNLNKTRHLRKGNPKRKNTKSAICNPFFPPPRNTKLMCTNEPFGQP